MKDDLNKPQSADMLKDAIKESINDWLEEKYAEIGKWTLHGLGFLVFSILAHAWLATHSDAIKRAIDQQLDSVLQ